MYRLRQFEFLPRGGNPVLTILYIIAEINLQQRHCCQHLNVFPLRVIPKHHSNFKLEKQHFHFQIERLNILRIISLPRPQHPSVGILLTSPSVWRGGGARGATQTNGMYTVLLQYQISFICETYLASNFNFIKYVSPRTNSRLFERNLYVGICVFNVQFCGKFQHSDSN